MDESRKNLTFAQAEGVEPLPSQLQLRTISSELSAALWAMVHTSLDEAIIVPSVYGGSTYLDDPWKSMLKRWWVVSQHRNIDEFPSPSKIHGIVKAIVTSRNYIEVFEFIQFIIRQKECSPGFSNAIGLALEKCRAPYRIIDKTIMPIVSDEEAKIITEAISSAAQTDAEGPRAHLKLSGIELSNGNWAASVRESIHAVEAAALILEPSANTLGPALSKLEQSISLSPALKKAFGALYGYSSDQEGIRHALIFKDKADVSEREAMFMFGVCASFVSYLLSAKT